MPVFTRKAIIDNYTTEISKNIVAQLSMKSAQ